MYNCGLTEQIPYEVGLWHADALLLSSGTILSELGQSQNLKWLKISQNRPTGTIPAEVAQMPKLVSFAVADHLLPFGQVPAFEVVTTSVYSTSVLMYRHCRHVKAPFRVQ